jgi:hypothetical protein
MESTTITAGDLTRTRGRKRKMADGESADTWTTRKSKVRFFDEKTCFTYNLYLHIEGNGLPYQGSCGGKRANGEDICKDFLAKAISK